MKNKDVFMRINDLKQLCPIHIRDLCKITNQTQEQVCLGWLRVYLREGIFTFYKGIIDIA